MPLEVLGIGSMLDGILVLGDIRYHESVDLAHTREHSYVYGLVMCDR
jgi:hypothetical protein